MVGEPLAGRIFVPLQASGGRETSQTYANKALNRGAEVSSEAPRARQLVLGLHVCDNAERVYEIKTLDIKAPKSCYGISEG